MVSVPAFSVCQFELGAPMPVEGLRVERSDLPTLAELILPGTLVSTSYGTGPYLIDCVTAYDFHGHRYWRLSGLEAPDGIAEDNEHRRGWLGGYVAIHDGETVRFLSHFANNPDEVRVVGIGSKVDRIGQMSLLP